MKSTLALQTNERKEQISFGIADDRKRTIGAEIFTFEAVFTPLPGPETGHFWYIQEPGYYYGLRCWATRNGSTFGPIQPRHYFKTTTERDAAIDRYLKDAKRRANGRAPG